MSSLQCFTFTLNVRGKRIDLIKELFEEELLEKHEELNNMEEKIEHLEEMNRVLIAKEWKSNDELQEARKELINVIS